MEIKINPAECFRQISTFSPKSMKSESLGVRDEYLYFGKKNHSDEESGLKIIVQVIQTHSVQDGSLDPCKANRDFQ